MSRTPKRQGMRIFAGAVVVLLLTIGRAQAQGPQVDVAAPPGAPEGRGKLGPALGASGTSSFDSLQIQGPIGGRPGPSVSRAFVSGLNPTASRPEGLSASFKLPTLPEAPVTRYGMLEIPSGPADIGPADGLTVDGAIERLILGNLTLMALRYEIPMADADILTASLRNNPILYADSQLVPYGHFSNTRPGGQTQYDVNITLPIDVSGKRKARTEVACRAKKVTEAQLQDAVRTTIDNLYTVYVDAVAAGETLQYSRAYAQGISEIYSLNARRLAAGAITPVIPETLRAQVEQAELQVHEAEQARARAIRRVGLLLGMTSAEAESVQIRDALEDFRPLPGTPESLSRTALESRPDLAAARLGLLRAGADQKLARASRFSDVYLLLQPYTFQDNHPLGFKSSYSYAVGATVALPVFNRNQGNIQRAKLNQRQTRLELDAQERQVLYEVDEGVREFQVSLNAATEIKNEVLPAVKRVLDVAESRFKNGAINVIDYLEARREYNEVVQKYRDALVRHRRAMLDLNTDVGVRVL